MLGILERNGAPAALLALARTVLAIVRTRADLLVVEVAQERRRLAGVLLYGGLAFIGLVLSLQLLAFGAVAWFWDTAYRWPALACVAGCCTALTALFALLAVRRLGARPRPFEATMTALATDLERS